MPKTYEVEQRIALALSTERVLFLDQLTDDEFRQEATVQLLRDLINDRAALRREVIKAVGQLRDILRQTRAASIRFSSLQDYLEGMDPEEIQEKQAQAVRDMADDN